MESSNSKSVVKFVSINHPEVEARLRRLAGESCPYTLSSAGVFFPLRDKFNQLFADTSAKFGEILQSTNAVDADMDSIKQALDLLEQSRSKCIQAIELPVFVEKIKSPTQMMEGWQDGTVHNRERRN